jgi:hypothetical protein
VADRAHHHLTTDSEIMKIYPAPRHRADDAQQPQPRCRNPAGDITLAGRQIITLRVAFSGRGAVR